MRSEELTWRRRYLSESESGINAKSRQCGCNRTNASEDVECYGDELGPGLGLGLGLGLGQRGQTGSNGEFTRSDVAVVDDTDVSMVIAKATHRMANDLDDDEPKMAAGCNSTIADHKTKRITAATATEKSATESALFEGDMDKGGDVGGELSQYPKISSEEGVLYTETTAQSEVQANSADDNFVNAGDIEMAEEEFYVDKVIGKRILNGVIQYKIRWKGYDDENDDTWEPLENLTDAMHLVNAFESKSAEGDETATMSRRRKACSYKSFEKQLCVEKKAVRESLENDRKENDLRTSHEKKSKASTGMKRRSPDVEHSYRVTRGEKIRKIVGIQKPGVDGKLKAVIQFLDKTLETIPTEVLALHEPIKLVRFYEQHLQFRDEIA